MERSIKMFLILFSTLILVNAKQKHIQQKIAGGWFAERNQFKYVAAMIDLSDSTRSPFCGASIIHRRFALTVS